MDTTKIPRGWTATEMSLLRQIYPTQGAKACMCVLPGKSLAAITQTAKRYSITSERGWSEEERVIVLGCIGKGGPAAAYVALKKAGYVRTVNAIRSYANQRMDGCGGQKAGGYPWPPIDPLTKIAQEFGVITSKGQLTPIIEVRYDEAA